MLQSKYRPSLLFDELWFTAGPPRCPDAHRQSSSPSARTAPDKHFRQTPRSRLLESPHPRPAPSPHSSRAPRRWRPCERRQRMPRLVLCVLRSGTALGPCPPARLAASCAASCCAIRAVLLHCERVRRPQGRLASGAHLGGPPRRGPFGMRFISFSLTQGQS